MAELCKLFLASGSPRRRQLLAEAGYVFEVVEPSAGAETPPLPGESPDEYVRRVARQKAADVAARTGQGLVLACDTAVACRGQLLGKPADAADARRILELLSGQQHAVYSGLCLRLNPQGRELTRVDKSVLRMQTLSPGQLDEYLASGQWQGKAGAFGYQDRLGWLHLESGSESNVVGLPLELFRAMLAELEVDVEMRPLG